MRQVLEGQQLQHKLGRGLPPTARRANKTADRGHMSHDAGWITWNGSTLLVAVLSQGVEPPGRASELIGAVARALMQACGGP
jgi:hypothetical protein